MQNSLLFTYLKYFDKNDIKELQKFVESPFFNNKEAVVNLFHYIVKNSDTPSVELQKERIFKAVFPDKKPYEDITLRQTMSALTTCIRQYLIYKELKNNELQENLLLIKALNRRKVDKVLERELDAAFKNVETQYERHSEYHRHKYNLYLAQYEQLHRRQRAGEMGLQKVSDELTLYYVSELLRQACVMLSHQNMSNQKYEQPLLKPILEKIEQNALEVPPSVAAYFHAYKALSDETQIVDFQQLKIIIVENWPVFPANELRDLYLLTLNFCIKQLNKGNESYNIEALEIYKNGLSNGALLENGNISPFTYNNVLRLAIKTQNWDWAYHFLIEYRSKLPIRERENLYKYNLALFHFRKIEYAQAMTLLQEVNLKEVLYNLDARQMLMRIYYEMSEWSALDSLLESFKIYLHRQTNIGYHRESYLNLIKFTKKLLKVNLKSTKSRAQLRGEIEASEQVTEKQWLLEKLK